MPGIYRRLFAYFPAKSGAVPATCHFFGHVAAGRLNPFAHSAPPTTNTDAIPTKYRRNTDIGFSTISAVYAC